MRLIAFAMKTHYVSFLWKKLADFSVDDFLGLHWFFSPICFLPRKTIHTLHTTQQTPKPQPDTQEWFVLKTLHTTLHQPYTPCFSKFVDITEWRFAESGKEFEKSARDLSFSISSVPRSGCNSAGLLDDG